MNKHSSAAGASAYHHGDLRNGLIIAAAGLIEETGAANFAMIDAARRAGVSSAAPYRHFKDRDELLRAVAELGFFELDLQLGETMQRYAAGDIECLIALGQCYLRFVTGKPAFFALMWGDQVWGVQGTNILAASEGTYALHRINGFCVLANQVEAWSEKESLEGRDAVEIAMTLWSIGMGLCHLYFDQQIEKFAPQINPYALLANSARAYLSGIKLNTGAS